MMTSCDLTPCFILSFFFKKKFIYFEREEWGGGEKERVPSRLHTISTEPDVGIDLTNGEIMT